MDTALYASSEIRSWESINSESNSKFQHPGVAPVPQWCPEKELRLQSGYVFSCEATWASFAAHTSSSSQTVGAALVIWYPNHRSL